MAATALIVCGIILLLIFFALVRAQFTGDQKAGDGGGGNGDGKARASACCPPTKPCVQKWAMKYHLPLWLGTVIVFGYFVPVPARALSDKHNTLQNACVIAIFLMSGLKLKTADVKKALRCWVGTGYAALSVLVLTPLLALALLRIDFGGPRELAVGLALFACMPTTLSSGVILVGEALGNVALALLVTVVTNLLGIITVPFAILLVFSTGDSDGGDGGGEVKLDAGKLLVKLILVIFIPLCVGKGLRHVSARARAFTAAHRVGMKLASSFFLGIIPWMKVSANTEQIGRLAARDLGAVALGGIGMHLCYLAFNGGVVWFLLPLGLKERKATIITSSQKTLPVAMTVLLSLPASFGDQGLMAIPIVVAHLMQIVIDAILAARWAVQQQARDAARRRARRAAKRAALENGGAGGGGNANEGEADTVDDDAADAGSSDDEDDEEEADGYGITLWTKCCAARCPGLLRSAIGAKAPAQATAAAAAANDDRLRRKSSFTHRAMATFRSMTALQRDNNSGGGGELTQL